MGEPASDGHAAVRLVVTGFGRFAGVVSNPSSWIVEQLEALHGPGGNTFKVLEVSADCVNYELAALADQLEGNVVGPVIWIHFGVHGMARRFKLEAQAFNDADFRVPDQAGWCPHREPIDPAFPVDHVLRTDMRAHHLAEILPHDVEVSDDAGRFVCNYTLYRSLQQCQQRQQQQLKLTDGSGHHSGNWHALFVHVPPFEVIPKQEQLAFASNLLRLVHHALPHAVAAKGVYKNVINISAGAPANEKTQHWPLPEEATVDGGAQGAVSHSSSVCNVSSGTSLQQLLQWMQMDRLRSVSLAVLAYLVWNPARKQHPTNVAGGKRS